MSISVMSQCWAQSTHAGSELLLLLAIADFSDDAGRSYPAVGTLAVKCRMTRRNVQYILKALVQSGEISIEPNKGPPPKFPNLYQINLRQFGVKSASREQSTARVKSTVARCAIQSTNGVQPTSPKPSVTINNHHTVNFDQFWNAYPNKRKGSKAECKKLWNKSNLDQAFDEIIFHLKAMLESPDWKKDAGAYIPAPLTYLRQQRWDGAELGREVDERFEGAL